MKISRAILILSCLFASPIVKGQEVISSVSPIELPTAGNTKTVSSGQSLRVISNQSITLKPGFTALVGSNVSLSIASSTIYPIPAAAGSANPELNWVLKRAFNENGEAIAEGKAFFDLSGQALQSQSKSFVTQHVFASQPIYDANGRPAIQTLSAPINNSAFSYKPDFVQNANNAKYNTLNFDTKDKLNNPDPVGAAQPGTLGWYYSNNNTWDAYVPATAFPYTRTDYFKDGVNSASRQAGVGEALKLGSGHEPVSNTFPVGQELSKYLAIRNKFFSSDIVGKTGQTDLANASSLMMARDAQGSWSMAVQDQEGHTLMTALPGDWLPVTNTVQLTNYLDELTIFSHLGERTTDIKLKGSGKLKVYDHDQLIYHGDFSAYTPPAAITPTNVYRLASDKPFTASYNAATGDNEETVCDNCRSQVKEGSVVGQNYHYLGLTKAGALNITGGGVNVVDLISNNVLYTNQSATVNLPAGMYKVVAASGQPQISYTNTWGDISYNYYNLNGQPIASIAPNGVQQVLVKGIDQYTNKENLPFTNLAEYDLMGRVMASTTTDGGRSEYAYTKDGKIRFSQNAEQRKTGRFSYTNYDELGRPIEAGEYLPGSSISFNSAKTDQALLNNVSADGGLTGGSRSDWMKTHYDASDNSHGLTSYVQDFTENAVSWTENANSKTWFSYDEQGRVTWMIKWINGLGFKTVDYTYDYFGNVTTVAYQKSNNTERFYHHYTYDADQRLVNVQTSRDGVNKLQQAAYQYYLHGPLKRVELGDNLQGIDYTYTAQGALKTINHPSGVAANDPGHDGANSFAADAFGLQLEYFNGDYTRANSNIGSVNTGQATYYNGMVSGMSWKSKKPQGVVSTDGVAVQDPTMYTYGYDNKYQLTGATWGTPNFTNNNFTAATKFAENNITYDFNGNIKALQRTNAAGVVSDNFNNYQYQAGTNKLLSAGSMASPESYAKYTYDDLGQLKSMQQAGVSFGMYLKYDVTGKITGIYADAALTQLKVGYIYDEAGNRISRIDNTSQVPLTTYYVYDGTGNVMAIYNGATMAEVPVYGSTRLGNYTLASNSYVYELRDNVESVRVVINRNKKADSTVDVTTYNDYFPFGSIARNGGVGYRYEYQGAYAEKDPVTGWNNFDLRMYDSKLGRWLSPDPKDQYASPYTGMGNNPVTGFDPDGGESTASPIIDKATGGILGYDSWGMIGPSLYATAADYNIYSNNGQMTIDHDVAIRAFEQFSFSFVPSVSDLGLDKAGFSIDKALLWLNNNSHPTYADADKAGEGSACARFVRLALEAGGIDTKDHPVPARLYGSYLKKWKFEETDTRDFKRGDIAVIQGYPGGTSDPSGVPYGHIEMYNGKQWMSNFKQNSFYPGNNYRVHKPPFKIYRW
ncbi:RHS repeat-associated core domain-containing protein [Mucilaginibacter sp. Bleaf8]|uniref:RHS repeat domain-containing protein n=1 Tax=Mucilaginibacter sp. Bleaf8 TaxID=2834430 RepID=UPI001BD00721|nr:RHS repeat-associated core domain-containing protein [Mucilaginibacter sp. Bleaf8]MBS7566478.1 RHS repeat-associated core domain-containing protein [Mucilaginibacter sp. Bleaf8]